MPLIQGKSQKAFGDNMKAEMSAGKPMNQALAIAHAIKRKNMEKKAKGGLIYNPSDSPEKKYSDIEETYSKIGAGKNADSGVNRLQPSSRFDQELAQKARADRITDSGPNGWADRQERYAMGGVIQGLNEGKAMIEDKFAEGGMIPEQGMNEGRAGEEDKYAHHIASMVMAKMSKGGMYAAGGEIPDDSDQDLYVEPMDGVQDHEDFLSDADQMPSEVGTPEEHKAKGMGARKVMLSNIMKKIR